MKIVHVQTSVSSTDDTYSQLTTMTGINNEEDANEQEISDDKVIEEDQEEDQKLLTQSDGSKEEESEKSINSARQGYKKKTRTMTVMTHK
eukprot:2914282-Ditylum_brightwellii.AAC.1